MAEREPVIGLALGSGSARGFAHVGVIRELLDHGVVPAAVCGSSVGAMVAASYATGRMAHLETWARGLTRLQIARFLDINAQFAGFVDQPRFEDFLNDNVASDDDLIEACDPRFAAVSTELGSAREAWLTQGSLKAAVIASMSLPGLFAPTRYDDAWHVDGGLVNPVPVSLCHAMGADIVIAVNLNGDILRRHVREEPEAPAEPAVDESSRKPETDRPVRNRLISTIHNLTHEYADTFLSSTGRKTVVRAPSVVNSFAAAINIMQDRITRSRMAGDPPDILLVPRLADIGLLDLDKAPTAIHEGRQCVKRMLPEILRLLGRETT